MEQDDKIQSLWCISGPEDDPQLSTTKLSDHIGGEVYDAQVAVRTTEQHKDYVHMVPQILEYDTTKEHDEHVRDGVHNASAL